MLDPERESVNVLLAEALRRRGRYESACQHYQRAFGYKRWNSYAIFHGQQEHAIPATVR